MSSLLWVTKMTTASMWLNHSIVCFVRQRNKKEVRNDNRVARCGSRVLCWMLRRNDVYVVENEEINDV